MDIAVLQAGLPSGVVDLLGLAGAIVLVLMLVALGGFAYKSLSGGIEWPEDVDEEDEGVRRGGTDDEWKYY